MVLIYSNHIITKRKQLKVSNMKRILAATMATITLAGCASKPVEIDPTPRSVNKNDSFAMQVLEAGWVDRVPFDIKDADFPEDATGTKYDYTSYATLGFLSNGLTGALGNTLIAGVMNAGGYPLADNIKWIFWVPADNIDINDKAAINDYIQSNYLKPALDEYISSPENTKMKEPLEFLGMEDGKLKVRGELCWAHYDEKPENEYWHTCYVVNNAPTAYRYATPDVGIPFALGNSDHAKRYIVAGAYDTSNTSHILLPFIKSKMTYAFVPGQGHKAHRYMRFTKEENRMFHDSIPYVVGMDKKVYPFIKTK